MAKTEKTIFLDTQSFRLTLAEDTFELLKINVHNEEVAGLYEDDKEGLTIALIRELAVNLQASKEVIQEIDKKKDDAIDGLNDEISKLEDVIDDLSSENDKLRSDNEVLRDELDDSK